MKAALRRLRDRTIWAPGALARVPKRYRPLYRVMLPIVDVIFGLFGVGGILIGSKAVETTTLSWFNPLWASIIGLAAVIAMIGLLFEIHRLELWAKVALAIALGIYAYLLVKYAQTDESYASLLTAALTLGILLIPIFRIFDLIDDVALDEVARDAAGDGHS